MRLTLWLTGAERSAGRYRIKIPLKFPITEYIGTSGKDYVKQATQLARCVLNGPVRPPLAEARVDRHAAGVDVAALGLVASGGLMGPAGVHAKEAR